MVGGAQLQGCLWLGVVGGLLAHLWAVGVRSKAFKLMQSYLSDHRALFVVANGDSSSHMSIKSGVEFEPTKSQELIITNLAANHKVTHPPVSMGGVIVEERAAGGAGFHH